jgi:hypothetical protein
VFVHLGTKVFPTFACCDTLRSSSEICCCGVYDRVSAAPLHCYCLLTQVASEGFCGVCSRRSKLGSRSTEMPRARLALALAAPAPSTLHPGLHLSFCWGEGSLGVLAQLLPACSVWRVAVLPVLAHMISRGLHARQPNLVARVADALRGQGGVVGVTQACTGWGHNGQPCLWLEAGLWVLGGENHPAFSGYFLGGHLLLDSCMH